VAQRVDRGIAVLFHDHSTRRGEWSAARPGRTLPPGKTRYPFYRRLSGNEAEESINNGKAHRILVGKQLEIAIWRTQKDLG